ncbi:hypothetical protein H4R99_006137 [Coemansia sp. RSA 1722]|nr:hypothetical protein IWW45_000251 [Coemansia sp. RSA 485]KAJ2593299.1 hypothetical protein H4R99_006137 [Coemansia sp. RSA 1722]KAJ2634891.1 hypothetical protein GGF40_003929 [Coemansia sp. RSA 1286]
MDPAQELKSWIKTNEAAREKRRAEYDKAYEDIAKACAELKTEMSQLYEKVAHLSAKAKEQPDDCFKDEKHENEMHAEAELANEKIKCMVSKLQELMQRFDCLIPGLSVAMSSDIVLTVPAEPEGFRTSVEKPKELVASRSRGKRAQKRTADIANSSKE